MTRLRKRLLGVGGAALVALLVGVGLPAFADPAPGSITGHLTDGGTPVPNSFVNASNVSTFESFFAVTDSSGAFTMTNVTPGDYRVSFQLPGGASQYAVQKKSFPDADLITVPDGGTATVEESVAPHGSITGHVTRADGSPATFLQVQAQPDGPRNPIHTSTDANGNYTMPTVWPDSYVISFGGFGATVQYAHDQLDFSSAERFTVTAGAALTVDETLLPTGAIAGQLTQNGQPVSFAQITIASSTGSVGFGSTGPDGRYRLELFPGTYTVEFRLQSGLVQYAHQKRTLATADRITVAAGPDTIVDEQLLPTGTISGRLVDAGGAGVPFAFMRITDGDGGFFGTNTSFDGTFSVSLLPGTYQVAFITEFGEQWARGKSSATEADAIEVIAGQTTLINETLAATGTLVVTARDRTTGEAVSTFCASAARTVCTEDGTATLPVLPGNYNVFISGAQQGDVAYSDTSVAAVVTSGQTTALVADLTRASSVRFVVKDRATGQPVRDACIELIQPLQPTDHDGAGDCSDENGHVTISRVRPAIYTAFVEARDGAHGHQWVGYHGGTGAQATARLIRVEEGATVAVPDIKLDPAGTLTGTVTDKATGTPVRSAGLLISSIHGRRGSGAPGVQAGADGRYTFGGLGPYEWTLFLLGQDHGAQFTGGVGNRFLATGAKVTAGQTSTFDVKLLKGATVTVNLTSASGGSVPSVDVVVVNALAGDEMGRAAPDNQTPYSLPVVGPQLVKLFVDNGANSFWVGGADFVHAQLFLIPATGTKTINVALP